MFPRVLTEECTSTNSGLHGAGLSFLMRCVAPLTPFPNYAGIANIIVGA